MSSKLNRLLKDLRDDPMAKPAAEVPVEKGLPPAAPAAEQPMAGGAMLSDEFVRGPEFNQAMEGWSPEEQMRLPKEKAPEVSLDIGKPKFIAPKQSFELKVGEPKFMEEAGGVAGREQPAPAGWEAGLRTVPAEDLQKMLQFAGGSSGAEGGSGQDSAPAQEMPEMDLTPEGREKRRQAKLKVLRDFGKSSIKSSNFGGS